MGRLVTFVNQLQSKIQSMIIEDGLSDIRVTWLDGLKAAASVVDLEVRAKALIDFIDANSVDDNMDWTIGA